MVIDGSLPSPSVVRHLSFQSHHFHVSVHSIHPSCPRSSHFLLGSMPIICLKCTIIMYYYIPLLCACIIYYVNIGFLHTVFYHKYQVHWNFGLLSPHYCGHLVIRVTIALSQTISHCKTNITLVLVILSPRYSKCDFLKKSVQFCQNLPMYSIFGASYLQKY